ncbi:MAG: helix-turn-helix domain-containing protein [Candidatus Shapirobacteria bacterium]
MISPQFFLDLRTKQNWTQSEMAGILGISRPTYVSVERGETSITIEQLEKLANKLGCEPQDILTENVVDEPKYKQVLLEVLKSGADADGKITKTKLAKLIYLVDFGWYYHHLEPLTGAKYRRLDQGPVPNLYFSVLDELIDAGLINLEVTKDCQLLSLTQAGQMGVSSKLTKSEKSLIAKISHKWQGKRTAEIVKFTHQQLPYQICSPGEIIPYELITQQDPEYVY